MKPPRKQVWPELHIRTCAGDGVTIEPYIVYPGNRVVDYGGHDFQDGWGASLFDFREVRSGQWGFEFICELRPEAKGRG